MKRLAEDLYFVEFWWSSSKICILLFMLGGSVPGEYKLRCWQWNGWEARLCFVHMVWPWTTASVAEPTVIEWVQSHSYGVELRIHGAVQHDPSIWWCLLRNKLLWAAVKKCLVRIREKLKSIWSQRVKSQNRKGTDYWVPEVTQDGPITV